jgi:hypothetical protein
MELLNQKTITKLLTRDAEWSWSHGAEGCYLGMGLLYYALVYIHRVKTAVCLGSGGGFVPRMMRQAQRDLGLAKSAKTILVDANKPGAGWGAPVWLSPNSFFRQAFSDIDLVISTTREAAKSYFASRAITIDYLHIDADHSFAGCLQDFLLYRPFLTEGSLVTLHDSTLPGAGVGAVVEYLRARKDCEVIDLPNVGFGTALVRITAGEESDQRYQRYAEEGEAVELAVKGEGAILNPPRIGWEYLESEPFAIRSVIAASFLSHCQTVVEIGGLRPAIDQFLHEDHLSIIVVEQFIRETKHVLQKMGPKIGPSKVRRVRSRFQDLEWTILQPYKYGLVMLDFELPGMSEDDYQRLFRLVDNSQVTILEFAPSWEQSSQQFRLLRRNTSMRERFACKLDLLGNDVGSLVGCELPDFNREIHVLEPEVSN